MVAGKSADAESLRLLELAKAHEQAAAESRAKAARFSIAGETERQTARTLKPLKGIGYQFLADRRWPGTRRAQVDLVVVGPGGLFIIDTKAWADVHITTDRIFRGQEDVTETILSLGDLADSTEAHFAEMGLAPGEVHAIAVLSGKSGINTTIGTVRIIGEKDALSHIARYGNRLTSTHIDQVMLTATKFFDETAPPAPIVPTVLEPVIPLNPEQDALISPREVQEALLGSILAKPVEEWMAFLHPKQAKLVRRTFPGPSRIRGSAGTGKTVVGLHRAAHLARTQPGRILVTTFVRTLPDVLGRLLQQLAPDVRDRVDFCGVHSLARKILQDRGVTFNLDPRGSDAAFTRAWNQVGRGSILDDGCTDADYWKEEIASVVKGRGIVEFDLYARLPRTGRRYRLPLTGRLALWDLYCAYSNELRRRQINDFADLILLASAELRREPMPGLYSHVLADEAQDLTCSMLRFLHGFVGDKPDGITLIGDGQQSIYPGGYTLGEAGISVAGRGVVLDINYRNTAQIISFAQTLVDGDEYPDIEGTMAIGDQPHSVPRSGPAPNIQRCSTTREVRDLLVQGVRAVSTVIDVHLGDIAVLCATRYAVQQTHKLLVAEGFPVVELSAYRGEEREAIKVGTIKRAKGLEFKHVFIPDVAAESIGKIPPQDPSQRERWDLARRELYVAMTRARDGLWVGVTESQR